MKSTVKNLFILLLIGVTSSCVKEGKEYFGNPQNWEIQPAFQINGTFTEIRIKITAELMEQFRQTE